MVLGRLVFHLTCGFLHLIDFNLWFPYRCCLLSRSFSFHQWNDYQNAESFKFCQRCRNERTFCKTTTLSLKALIYIQVINARKSDLLGRRQANPYGRQKSALEKELTGFSAGLVPPFDTQSATPGVVLDFLIWKVTLGKRKCIRKVVVFFRTEGEFPVLLSQAISLRHGRFSNRKTPIYILLVWQGLQ